MAQADTHAPLYDIGARWRSQKNKKGSSTPGKQKGENCQATAIQKGMARHNRAYRVHPYSSFCHSKVG